MRLLELSIGQKASIKGYKNQADTDLLWVQRLKEFGLITGALIEMKHRSPWGGSGAIVSIRGADVALRGEDLQCIEVELVR